jgi:hypothetical protein
MNFIQNTMAKFLKTIKDFYLFKKRFKYHTIFFVDMFLAKIKNSIKHRLKKTLLKLKEFFNLGSFPDYIIIGAQKGGTSSLHKYLGQHPYIIPSFKKEVHFFDKSFHKGKSWYKSHFPIFKRLRKKLSGEASPYYIFHPLVPERIYSIIPNVKLILILRNPIDRAYSHYNMEYNRGDEKNSFKEVIKLEERRLKNEEHKIRKGQYSWEHQCHSYLARGKYVEQLENWLKFFRKKQILIITSEDLFLNPQKECSKLFKFLGLPDYKLNSIENAFKGEYNKKIETSMQNFLNKYFEPYNKKLYMLLDRNFKW